MSYPEEKDRRATQPGTEAAGTAGTVPGNAGAACPQAPWWAGYGYGPPPGFAQAPQAAQDAAPAASPAGPTPPSPQAMPAWGPYMGPPPGYGGHGHHHHGHGWGYPGMGPQWAGFPPAPIGPWGGFPPVPAAPTPGAAAAAQPLADHPHYHGLAEAALNLNDNAFVKGLLIGAGATFLLTNDTVQRNIIAAAVKVWSTMQGGVEEMKERFRDAEAELHAGGEEEG